jgi:hypothetical protein
MHVRRALALAVVGPLLLAGCSGDPEPTPNIPDPTSSSPTPSPTDSETPEVESAEEFIRRWVDVNTAMQATGDVGEYVALSRRCKPCKQTAERVEAIYANGGFIETEGWLIDRVIDRTGSGDSPVLDLRITSTPTKYRESADAPTESFEGGRIVMRVRLNDGEPWQVIQLTQVAS